MDGVQEKETEMRAGGFQRYKNIPVFHKILGGFVLGIAAGLILGPQAAHLNFLGQIMVRLMTMVVIPIVICMMVLAVGNVGSKSVGKMGFLATLLFTVTTPVAILVGLFFGNVFNVGANIPAPSVAAAVAAQAPPSIISTIVNIFPNNIFAAMTAVDLLQIMAFSIMLGLAIAFLPNKENKALLINFFSAFNDAMQKILTMVMGFMPLGVMGIMANLVGTNGLDSLLPFGSFIGAVYASGLAIFLLFQVFFLARVIGGVAVKKYLSSAKEALLFAYATSSSFATLPLAMKAARKMGIKDRVANFTVPYGIVVNMDGTAAYLAIATVFIARIYGIELGMTQIVTLIVAATLASFGTSGTPGAGVVMLNSVLLMIGLPLDAVILLIGFDRLLIGPVRTVLNVSGDFAVCAIIDRFTRGDSLETKEEVVMQPAPVMGAGGGQ